MRLMKQLCRPARFEKSTFIGGFVGRQLSPTRDTGSTPSLLWFAAIQGVERKQDPADLAPKRCFVSAQPIEREVGQVGETQKATRELEGRIDPRISGFRLGAGCGLNAFGNAIGRRTSVKIDRLNPPKQRIDDLARGQVGLAGPPESAEMISLDFEQPGFDGPAATTDWPTAAPARALPPMKRHSQR